MTKREVGLAGMSAAAAQAKKEGRLWLVFTPLLVLLLIILPLLDHRDDCRDRIHCYGAGSFHKGDIE
jgi:hypothetical protein|tara:strand:+ start:1404 stop:1604 length:201 start_codon:yes stop_codon:yes gene_type:complete